MLKVLFFLAIISQPVCALDLRTSGKSDVGDNPFVATGFNKETGVITGYLSAIRTAPGRTDECKFLFVGNLKKSNILTVRYILGSEDVERDPAAISKAVMTDSPENAALVLEMSSLQADCEWILPFIGEPRIHEGRNELSISVNYRAAGAWTGVYLIRAPRARFHNAPTCLVSCDHIPRRSWPLFRAKAALGELIAGFSSPGIQPQQEQLAA